MPLRKISLQIRKELVDRGWFWPGNNLLEARITSQGIPLPANAQIPKRERRFVQWANAAGLTQKPHYHRDRTISLTDASINQC